MMTDADQQAWSSAQLTSYMLGLYGDYLRGSKGMTNMLRGAKEGLRCEP